MSVEVDAAKKRLGRKIVRARELAGLNQRQLAERLVTRTTRSEAGTGEWHRDVVSMQRNLRRYENGHNTPRGDLLMLIAAETAADSAHFTSDDDDEEDDPVVDLVKAIRRVVRDELAKERV